MRRNPPIGPLDGDDTPLSTPFEQWCEERGVHPEDPLAWEFYEAVRASRHPAEH